MPAERLRFTIVPPPPYSLALTASRYARFPEVVDRFDGRVYGRWIRAGRRGALLEVAQAGPASRARLRATLTGPDAADPRVIAEARRLIGGALGASADVQPFYRAHASDPILSDAIRDFAGLRIAGAPSLWEAIVTAVLSQQVNLSFAYDVRRHLALSFGRRFRLDGELWFTFPSPERLLGQSRSLRRGFRLSGAKAGTLLRLADLFVSGDLSEEKLVPLSDEDAIARLTEVQGVGRWTAEIALLRGLAREDVFPAADLGVVKYLAVGLLGHAARVGEAEMRKFAERWRPYRGLALVYAYAELNRRQANRITAAPPREKPPPRSGEAGSATRRKG